MITLNIGVPLSMVNRIIDDGEFNPPAVRWFLTKFYGGEIVESKERHYTYAVKVDEQLKKEIVYYAEKNNLTLMEYTAGLYNTYYTTYMNVVEQDV